LVSEWGKYFSEWTLTLDSPLQEFGCVDLNELALTSGFLHKFRFAAFGDFDADNHNHSYGELDHLASYTTSIRVGRIMFWVARSSKNAIAPLRFSESHTDDPWEPIYLELLAILGRQTSSFDKFA
jgi:hypothetical protein